MYRYYLLAVIGFGFLFDTSNQQKRSPVIGPCVSKDFIQKIDLSSPGCPVARIVNLPNKMCLGVCPNVYEPNLQKSANGIFNRCIMCKPDVKIVTAIVPCDNGTHTWKHFRQLTIVQGCACTYIDCECPLRDRDMFEKLKKAALKHQTVYRKKKLID